MNLKKNWKASYE